MKRREFIALAGGAAAVWPLSVRAQAPKMRVIGFLGLGSPEGEATRITAFRRGLNESGYVEGRNATIEFRWALNDSKRLPELADDLVRRRVDVIVVPSDTPAVLAAKAATTTIPIVFQTGTDPVQSGLVVSLSRPGGNLTGVTGLAPDLTAKRLGLLNEIRPGAGLIAVLVSTSEDFAGRTNILELQAAAATIGRTVEVFGAGSSGEIDTAFENMAKRKAAALLIVPNNLFTNRAGQIAILCARYGLPAIHTQRSFTTFGGLMSYGQDEADALRQVGSYAARILNGEKPADLPVMQPTRFEFVINLQTAKTLGIDVPTTLLARTDEVIE